MSGSREEYIRRINGVMNWVDGHLAEPIDLVSLAAVAHFSPFHFHRVFTMMTGETPADYVQRVRVERAAMSLQSFPQMSVAEVATLCGFGSAALLSRSFRAAFGMTPTQWRRTERSIFYLDGRRFSKSGQVMSKNGQSVDDDNFDLCSVNLNQIIVMDTKIEIREFAPFDVAYIRYMGAYAGVGEVYGRLARWAGPRGLLSGGMLTLYLDDPAVTEQERIRQDVCVPLKEGVAVEGEIGKQRIAGGKYAVGRFTIDYAADPQGFQKAWNTMALWLVDNGWQFAGSPYEFYGEPIVEGAVYTVEIRIPIMPL